MPFLTSDDPVERYRQARTFSQEVNRKLMRFRPPGVADDIVKSARKLTLPVQGRTIVFDGELESAALADFHFYEMRFVGRRLVDLATSEALGLNADETRMLEAFRSARPGLFRIDGADPDVAAVHLTGVLPEAGEQVRLSDISLSGCSGGLAGALMYLRVIRFEGVAMSGGVFFAFPASDQERLLREHRHRMATVKRPERSLRNYIFFYRQSRQFGIDSALSESGPEFD